MPFEPPLIIKKLSALATVPRRGSSGAAGLDLFSARECTVPAHGKLLVDTDIAIELPAGTYGRVAPRSGLANKHFLDVGAGVVDADYRGSVGVVLFNHSDTDFHIRVGDRIAQLIVERIMLPDIHVVDVDQELSATERGSAGYGSTGVRD